MANCIIVGGGSGGALSSDVTASKANVLAGTKTITSDSANAVVDGTMVNRGTINHTLSINGSYTIPQGYHSGSGKVSQSVSTKGAATYYATTADQTIAANQYLTGVQTIKKLTQTNLAAGNIKNGTTVKVNNGNADVWSVTGNVKTPTATKSATAYKGYGASSNQLTEEETYTMPRAGTVYYCIAVTAYGGSPNVTSGIYVNNTAVETRSITTGTYGFQYFVNGAYNVAAGAVVKIKSSITNGTNVFAMTEAIICC